MGDPTIATAARSRGSSVTAAEVIKPPIEIPATPTPVSDKPGLRKSIYQERPLLSRLEDDRQKPSFKIRVGLRQPSTEVRVAPFTVTYTVDPDH